MENQQIFDTNKTGRVIFFLALFAVIISLIPIITYYNFFKNCQISQNPSDWAAFGSFVGGTSGIVLSFFAVLFSLVSIYITIKISKYIHLNDFNFKTNQAQKELQLTHAQRKPYPYIHLQKLPKLTSIEIQNMGLGPLIINQVRFRYNKNEYYYTINKLFDAKLKPYNIQEAKIIINSAPNHIIAINSSKSILNITPFHDNEENINFNNIQANCRSILKECEIIINYEDMFKNCFEHSQYLNFFKEDFPELGF